jgi:hypothetical protein
MELEDLKRRWEEQDRKLDAGLRLNRRLLEQSVLTKAETSLRRLTRLLWLELLLDLVPVVWLGSFLADHIGQPRFWIPAAALDVFAIGSVAALAREAFGARSVDWGAPVVEIQQQVEAARIRRIRATQWTLALAPLLWTPLLVVALQGFWGVDAYAALGGVFLAANVLFGLAVLGLAVWASRRWAGRGGEASSVARRFARVLAGRSLADAQAFLGSLGRFAADEPRG